MSKYKKAKDVLSKEQLQGLRDLKRAAQKNEITRTKKDGEIVLKKRGRPKLESPRINKTLRLDADLVRAMEQAGQYSARAEAALRREFIGS